MVKCPKCGTALDANARFCSNCGTLVIITASHEDVQTGPVSPLREIFTTSTYLVHTKVSEAYRSRDAHSGLGIRYQFSTFEFREPNGTLLAITRHIEEGAPPTATTKYASLPSLLSSTLTYSLETARGVRIGELLDKAVRPINEPCLEIKDAAGNTIACVVMRIVKKPGSGFFGPALTSWTIETQLELARINWGKGNRDWTIETPHGEAVAEVQRVETVDQGYETTHQLKITSTKLDPYLIIATFLATPPTSGGGFHLHTGE